jgi:hypothetical protein
LPFIDFLLWNFILKLIAPLDNILADFPPFVNEICCHFHLLFTDFNIITEPQSAEKVDMVSESKNSLISEIIDLYIFPSHKLILFDLIIAVKSFFERASTKHLNH